jgi:hypothetical protein
MLAALSVCSYAQNPVSLSISVKPTKVKAGDKLTAQISATIAINWHIVFSMINRTEKPETTDGKKYIRLISQYNLFT